MLKGDAEKMTPEELAEHRERVSAQAVPNSVYEQKPGRSPVHSAAPAAGNVIELDEDGITMKLNPESLDSKSIARLCKIVGVTRGKKKQAEVAKEIITKVNGG
jgi:hypothetical protein